MRERPHWGLVASTDTRAYNAHPSDMTTGAPVKAQTLLLHRIRGEFLEMPGLHLTLPQAARLWHLDVDTCDRALRTLIADGFLRQTARGAFQLSADG